MLLPPMTSRPSRPVSARIANALELASRPRSTSCAMISDGDGDAASGEVEGRVISAVVVRYDHCSPGERNSEPIQIAAHRGGQHHARADRCSRKTSGRSVAPVAKMMARARRVVHDLTRLAGRWIKRQGIAPLNQRDCASVIEPQCGRSPQHLHIEQ